MLIEPKFSALPLVVVVVVGVVVVASAAAAACAEFAAAVDIAGSGSPGHLGRAREARSLFSYRRQGMLPWLPLLAGEASFSTLKGLTNSYQKQLRRFSVSFFSDLKFIHVCW